MLPVAGCAGVQFSTEIAAEGTLCNRDANLILLILENLIQNAVQATPAGKEVKLRFGKIFTEAAASPVQESLFAEVQDEGSGLPTALQENLFTPCRSTKPGGAGIGLAISKQLAKHLGANLELKQSSAQGCVFRLTLADSKAAESGFPVSPVELAGA